MKFKIKFGKKTLINYEMDKVKSNRFTTAFFYFMAGANFQLIIEHLNEREFVMAAIDAVFVALAFYCGTDSRKNLEKAIELDSHIEGYKHGMRSANERYRR